MLQELACPQPASRLEKFRRRVIERDRCCVYCASPDGLTLRLFRPLETFARPEAGMFDANAVTVCRSCVDRREARFVAMLGAPLALQELN